MKFGIIFFLICVVGLCGIFGVTLGLIIAIPAGIIVLVVAGLLGWLDDAFGSGKWEREEYRQDREDERLERYLEAKVNDRPHWEVNKNLNVKVDARSVNFNEKVNNNMASASREPIFDLRVNNMNNENYNDLSSLLEQDIFPNLSTLADGITKEGLSCTVNGTVGQDGSIEITMQFNETKDFKPLKIIYMPNGYELNEKIINVELTGYSDIHKYYNKNEVKFETFIDYCLDYLRTHPDFEISFREGGVTLTDKVPYVKTNYSADKKWIVSEEQDKEFMRDFENNTVIFIKNIAEVINSLGLKCDFHVGEGMYDCGKFLSFSFEGRYDIEGFSMLYSPIGFFRGKDFINKPIEILDDLGFKYLDITIPFDAQNLPSKDVAGAFIGYLSECPLVDVQIDKTNGVQIYRKSAKPRRQPIPEAVRHAVWRRDCGKCVQCGSQEKLEFDHIIPLSKGGSSTERNLQLLCESCNRRKSANI